MAKKITHGGKRKGAGRPALGKVKRQYTIDADLVERLDEIKNRSEFVNAAIREKLEGKASS